MALAEGTYTNVKDQAFVDFYVHLGMDKDYAQKALGTHWTMKVWKTENGYGCHETCKECPSMNCIDVFQDGVEKEVCYPLLGGKIKVTMTKDGSVVHSDKYGKIEYFNKYTECGVTVTISAKGKSFTEEWKKTLCETGCFIFESQENLDSYAKAVGCPAKNISEIYQNYRVYLCKEGHNFHVAEAWGHQGKVCNTFKLDTETAVKFPGEKDCKDTGKTAVVTCTGLGKYTKILKHKNGLVEEYKYSITDCGMCVTATEKRTGQSFKLHLKRYNDFSGTYKVLTVVGLEDFMKKIGCCSKKIPDHDAKMVVCDFGKGWMRMQMICKSTPLDSAFQLHEETKIHHPILDECVSSVATKNGDILSFVAKTSKGIMKTTFHFNKNFVVQSTCLKCCSGGGSSGYKVIYQRQCQNW